MRRGWFFLAAGLFMTSDAGADEPIKRYQVVSPKGVGIEVTAMNGRGDVVGFEWADDPAHPGVVEQRPFLARGREMTYLPLLEGYTATFPAAVSDDGLVVGRASKPAPPGVRRPHAQPGVPLGRRGRHPRPRRGGGRTGPRSPAGSPATAAGSAAIRSATTGCGPASGNATATPGRRRPCRTPPGSRPTPWPSAATAGTSRPSTGTRPASGRGGPPASGRAR